MSDIMRGRAEAVEALAEAWREMNEIAFVSASRPHGSWGLPSEGTEAIYASNFLVTLNTKGYTIAATPPAPSDGYRLIAEADLERRDRLIARLAAAVRRRRVELTNPAPETDWPAFADESLALSEAAALTEGTTEEAGK